MREAADYIEQKMPNALTFPHRLKQLVYAAALAPPGLALEFGVFSGKSITLLAEKFGDRQFFGFDSFRGLPEQWGGTRHRPTAFNLGGNLPAVPNNVTLVPGWFNETLPPFVAQHNELVAFLHIDCDLYSSTKTVLDAIGPRLAPRAVIVFDEFFGYPGYKHHEFKAFHEWAASSGAKYDFLGWSGFSVSLQLTS